MDVSVSDGVCVKDLGGNGCGICGGSTWNKNWWPLVRAPLRRKATTSDDNNGIEDDVRAPVRRKISNGSYTQIVEDGAYVTRRCHFECVLNVIDDEPNQDFDIEASFVQELRALIEIYPRLLSGKCPPICIAHEEDRLRKAAGKWPLLEIPPPPSVIFAFEGPEELRVSSCPGFSRVPTGVGGFYGLKALVFISCSLTEIPEEVGSILSIDRLYLNGNFLRTLPAAVCRLPRLQELCLDSNLIEELPPMDCPKLELLTAPANRLRTLPSLSGALVRIEFHGNFLSTLEPPGGLLHAVRWDCMQIMKLMGNSLYELPEAISQMTNLRSIMVAGNRLRALPACVSEMRKMEWIFAYNNFIEHLPPGMLTGSKWLERVLLEGNPLSVEAVQMIAKKAYYSYAKVITVDWAQVQKYLDLHPQEKGHELPCNISVGSLVHSEPLAPSFYMKLLRASQIRREAGVQAMVHEEPAKLLVVAFAASQGEPEWMGLLRRIVSRKKVASQPPPEGDLGTMMNSDANVAHLWDGCTANDSDGPDTANTNSSVVELDDFDVLCLIDHRMRWYAEDVSSLEQAVGDITKRYQRVLFVGASMGGFGAIMHGSKLADAVLAFGPQARLDHAVLRPPAPDAQALVDLSASVRAAVVQAHARGASVDVHCAADEHLWHALSLPLGDLKLTVHPLLPRKPFARLLDRADILEPIVADAMCHLLLRDSSSLRPELRKTTDVNATDASLKAGPEPGVMQSGLGNITDANTGGVSVDTTAHRRTSSSEPGSISNANETAGVVDAPSEPRVAVLCWGTGGRFRRYWSRRAEVMAFLFGPRAQVMPRPGDWFCAHCKSRNMSSEFFCFWEECRGSIVDEGIARVPGGRFYPRARDWGCGHCRTANCGYDWECTGCFNPKDFHAKTVICS